MLITSRVMEKLSLVMRGHLIDAEFLTFLGMLLQNRLDALHREQAKEREETENKIKGLVNEVRRNLIVVFAVEKGVFQCRQNLRLVIWSRCRCC